MFFKIFNYYRGTRFRYVRRRRVLRKRKPSNYRDYLARKEAARALVISRLNYFYEKYGQLNPAHKETLKYSRLSIRNQRSRWGSCSARKNLNFNYRILDLEPELQDYIIVHELCHLKELNHGQGFWDLMALTIPKAMELHHIARKFNLKTGRAISSAAISGPTVLYSIDQDLSGK